MKEEKLTAVKWVHEGIKYAYDKNTGILLQINEQSSTYEGENLIDQQSINIINVIDIILLVNYILE